jgi:hypothetical protein
VATAYAQLQWLPLRPHVRVRYHVLKALDSPGRGLFALRLLSSNKEALRRRALTASSCGALSSFFNASICASETFLASSAAFAELPRLLQRRVVHQVGPCWAYDHFCVLRIVLRCDAAGSIGVEMRDAINFSATNRA